jgi:hypothetical protein
MITELKDRVLDEPLFGVHRVKEIDKLNQVVLALESC